MLTREKKEKQNKDKKIWSNLWASKFLQRQEMSAKISDTKIPFNEGNPSEAVTISIDVDNSADKGAEKLVPIGLENETQSSAESLFREQVRHKRRRVEKVCESEANETITEHGFQRCGELVDERTRNTLLKVKGSRSSMKDCYNWKS